MTVSNFLAGFITSKYKQFTVKEEYKYEHKKTVTCATVLLNFNLNSLR